MTSVYKVHFVLDHDFGVIPLRRVPLEASFATVLNPLYRPILCFVVVFRHILYAITLERRRGSISFDRGVLFGVFSNVTTETLYVPPNFVTQSPPL